MQAKIARYKKAILTIAGGVISIAAMQGIDLGLTPEETAAIAGALATVLSGLLVVFGPPNAPEDKPKNKE